MDKRGYLWLLVLLLVFPVSAADTTGSIRLHMSYQGAPVAGGKVILYDVTQQYGSVSIDEMVLFAKSGMLDGVMQEVGTDGTICFSNLEKGIYLLVQNPAADGYYPVKPFCINIPITVGDQLQYQIEAFPKLEPLPETELPQTGLIRFPVWGLTGGGFSLLALGLLLMKRK